MMSDSVIPSDIAEAKYVALKSFRKSGEAVITPVWIVHENDELFIFTQGDSGKVKRIRRDGRVEIAPSSMRGTVKGEWQTGVAQVEDSPAAVDHVIDLLERKYGLEYKLFVLFKSKEKVRKGRVIVRVRLNT